MGLGPSHHLVKESIGLTDWLEPSWRQLIGFAPFKNVSKSAPAEWGCCTFVMPGWHLPPFFPYNIYFLFYKIYFLIFSKKENYLLLSR